MYAHCPHIRGPGLKLCILPIYYLIWENRYNYHIRKGRDMKVWNYAWHITTLLIYKGIIDCFSGSLFLTTGRNLEPSKTSLPKSSNKPRILWNDILLWIACQICNFLPKFMFVCYKLNIFTWKWSIFGKKRLFGGQRVQLVSPAATVSMKMPDVLVNLDGIGYFLAVEKYTQNIA